MTNKIKQSFAGIPVHDKIVIRLIFSAPIPKSAMNRMIEIDRFFFAHTTASMYGLITELILQIRA